MDSEPKRPSSVTEGVTIPDLLGEPAVAGALPRRVLWGLGALLCFVLGVVGWLLPVVTGIPFYLLGIALLAKALPSFGRWLNRWERGWPLRVRLWLRPSLRKRVLAERRHDDS